jgi:O-methyltransferase
MVVPYGRGMDVSSRFRQAARALRNGIAGFGLSPVSRTVLREGLTYLSPSKLRRIEAALRSVDDVPGDFAEFGVALGGSAILIANAAEGRQFHGFDVFGLIPEPTSGKDDEKSRQRYRRIRSGKSAGIDGQLYYGYRKDLFSEVKDSFSRHGFPVGENGVHLYKGLFEKTWPTASVDALALVHIDCDWYDPVVYCLEGVGPKLSPGGVIIIDDYHDYGGCRTAVEEFLTDNPLFAFEDGPNPFLRRLG